MEPVKELNSETKNEIEYQVESSFFDSFKRWPGFKWTYQVPLLFGTLENSVHLVELGVDAIGESNLFALEIGNEPKAAAFGNQQQYVNQWRDHAGAIASDGNISLPTKQIFQGLTLGSGASPDWNV